MRILNVARSLDPAAGGPSEGLRQSVQATALLGHVEEVATLDATAAPWLAGFPAPVHAFGPVRSGYGHTARLVPWLREAAARFDAVVVHGLWQFQGLAVHRALAGTSTPYFVYPHGMLDPWFAHRYPAKHLKKTAYWKLVEHRVLRDAAAVFFTAEEEARLAARSFRPYRVRARVVGYGIAPPAGADDASSATFHARWPETTGKRIVLFLGRLHEKKGCDLLLDAFAAVAGEDARLHLVVAGPDDATGLRARLEARAQALGIAPRTTWTGMLAGVDKWSALKAADVFALPSHQENFGVAVVEALATGLPVVVSDKVNICREIERDGAGIVGGDSVAGTIASLRTWLGLDARQRETMRRAAAACFRARFHASASARRTLDAIAEHVRAPTRSSSPGPIHGGATKRA